MGKVTATILKGHICVNDKMVREGSSVEMDEDHANAIIRADDEVGRPHRIAIEQTAKEKPKRGRKPKVAVEDQPEG